MNIKTQKTLIASLLGASFFLTLPVVANDGCDVGGKYSVRTLENIKVGACSVADGGNGGNDNDNGNDNGDIDNPDENDDNDNDEDEDPELCKVGDADFNLTDTDFNGNGLYSVNREELENLVDGASYCVDGYLIDSYADTVIDTSKVTDMSMLFSGININYSINDWNVSNVVNMERMFEDAPIYQKGQVDISGWKVGNVNNMNKMFQKSTFNQDLSDWDVSNVRSMNGIFKNTSFYAYQMDLSKWDVNNVYSCIDFNKDHFAAGMIFISPHFENCIAD